MSAILAILIGVLPQLPFKGKLTPQLREQLSSLSEGEKVFAVVHLAEEYPYEAVKSLSYKEKAEVFRQIARESQGKVIEELASLFSSSEYKIVNQFWVYNGFHIRAGKRVIEFLASRDDIWFISENREVRIIANREYGEPVPNTPEWNISNVRADSVWTHDGYDGSGVIIGHIDTGVDVTHPALSGKWTGYWFDGVNGNSSPYDDHSHGTHTMGTILGGDGTGPFTDDIGVAPGAFFATAKAFDAGGGGSYATIDPCMQFMADLKADSGVDIRAVSNSWGGGGGDTHWWDIIWTWMSLDILPVFANGNSGPGPGTVGAPGDHPHVVGIGATDASDNIASFSSRGPAPNTFPYNDTTYWFRSDWNYIKPQISAPGVSVRSSIPGGGYGNMSGTSMATPHVAGAVAILVQKNPGLTVYDLYNLFLDFARQPTQGEPYPNNDYGWGILNVHQSFHAVPGGNTPYVYILSYTLTDAGNDGVWDPGESAQIVVTLKNTGDTASSVQATLRTASSYVTITDSLSDFGTMFTNDTVNNNTDPYLVTADPSTPEGTSVQFTLHIVADTFTFDRTFTEYIGIPGLDFVTHDVGNIVVTVTRYGSIGYMNSSQSGGQGVRYPSSSASHLFYGGFALGNSSTYVADRYYEQNQTDDADWITTTTPDGKVKMYEPGPFSDEYAKGMYDDTGEEAPYNILVYQESWAWGDPNGDDFVIMKFNFVNNGSNTASNLYSAMFMDWDIGNYSNNQGSSDTARNLTYMYETTPYVGVATLDPPREDPLSEANLALIDHDVYVYPYEGLPDNIQIQFMDGSINSPSSNRAYDWSTCNSAGPFSLSPGDSLVTAFAIVGGNSLSELRENADTAYNRYWNLFAVSEKIGKPLKFSSFKVIPTVVKDGNLRIYYTLSKPENVRIIFYNPAGQKILSLNRGYRTGESLKIETGSLLRGIYFVHFETSERKIKQKVIFVK